MSVVPVIYRRVFGVLSLVLVCGCGEVADRPKLAPVSGSVKYNGNPVAGATVSFFAEGAPRAASGITDADGKFQLMMFEGTDGAIPGKNKITVTKASAAAAPADPTAMMADPTKMTGMMQAEKGKKKSADSELPEIYGSQEKTPLYFDVTADGPNVAELQLKDQ